MISASEPQEFIPSGRQLLWRHPGQLNPIPTNLNVAAEAFLSHCFQRVTISEKENSDRWIVRESPESTQNYVRIHSDKTKEDQTNQTSDWNKSKMLSELVSEESWSWRTIDPNVSFRNARPMDANSFKPNQTKNFPTNEYGAVRNDTKSGSNSTSKMCLSSSSKRGSNCVRDLQGNISNPIEEELYIKGNVAIWSKGLSSSPESIISFNESRVTVCSYTMDSPIRHALWCNFYSDRPKYNLDASLTLRPDETYTDGEEIPSVCLIDAYNMRVFTKSGEDFVTNLQFQVSSVWTTRYGILLEAEQDKSVDSKQVSYNKSHNKNSLSEEMPMQIPSLYSLVHPLDEACPVLIRPGHGATIAHDPMQRIVFTCSEPSLCMVYDGNTGLHSVLRYRKVNPGEVQDYTASLSKISVASNHSSKLRQNFSSHGRLSFGLTSAAASPFCSRATSTTSLSGSYTAPSRAQSPMASISRCQSPSMSPLVAGTIPNWVNKSHPVASPSAAESVSSETPFQYGDTTSVLRAPTPYRPTPQFCLELVWTEGQATVRENSSINGGAATKVFLSTDFIGQTYLCYLVGTRLCVIRVDLTNSRHLIFGVITYISAKDAISIPHLHLMAVLELDGSVVLYSGVAVVGKLLVGGILAERATPAAILKSPFPRRSSLLPQFKSPSVDLKFEESMYPILSPVPSISSSQHCFMNRSPLCSSMISESGSGSIDRSPQISGLRDAVFDRLTLQYSDGVHYRIRLPSLAEGSLTRRCLSALCQTLQRDSAVSLLSRWYAARNAPGPVDISVKHEWHMFANLLLSMLGYNTELLKFGQRTMHSNSPVLASKRKRGLEEGRDSDWQQLFTNEQNALLSEGLSRLLGLESTIGFQTKNKHSLSGNINTSATLFPHIPLVLFTLHLVYEEIKLNTLLSSELPMLVELLHLLAIDLRAEAYSLHYWLDFPDACALHSDAGQIAERDLEKVIRPTFVEEQPPDVMRQLYNMLCGKTVKQYPYINMVNTRTRDIIQLSSMILAYRKGATEPHHCATTPVRQIIPVGGGGGNRSVAKHITFANQPTEGGSSGSLAERTVLLMTELGFERQELENLPPSIALLLHDALWQCRENAPTTWPIDAYYLLGRDDLAAQVNTAKTVGATSNTEEKLNHYAEPGIQDDLRCPQFFTSTPKSGVDDGMEHIESEILRLRFPKDRRVAEVRRLLQSASPVTIRLVQRPEVTDHDFIEEQEKHLYAISHRTMALPAGRGMFTLRTHTPVITEVLPIPRLCLGGKAPPRGTAVELTHIDTPANMNLWPLFHNGVAAGLSVNPNATDINSPWIVFNKPKGPETPTEHAGFLMALGLNGHLKNLDILNTYEYLKKVNEMTSVGLLLGLAATKRGTMDTMMTKMLSIHLEALLPPTSMELDVPQNVQVAALMGIGLVYQGSAHRHITEVLLAEIGRPPGPEMENCVDREAYSLAAGLALGLVTLGLGGRPSGLADLAMPDTLHYYMVGGNRRPLTGKSDKYKVSSFQIHEGSNINLDVTCPGATLALGLMYIGSGNQAVAEWMRPPDTQYLLEFIRPDYLLLRIVARALILWDDVTPSKEWVESQVPGAIRPFCLVKPEPDLDENVDYEAMNQAYCNIVAGACFALGLKYAGSGDEKASRTLACYTFMFASLTGKSIAELAGKPTIETCLNVVLISFSMVMAGTGDLTILRLVRYLRRRVNPSMSASVPYGAHLATHMALGLLFLGGGRLTLSSSPASVAALLCAFFPKFPTHSNDNRYHLQAFRHFYVLAVEPRLVVPRDVLKNTACYANLKVTKLDDTTYSTKAPCILPELAKLKRVCVEDERYWPIVFDRERNWNKLLQILEGSGYLDIKQRAGCLSYVEDPLGLHSLLARTISKSQRMPWTARSEDFDSFSMDSGTDISWRRLLKAAVAERFSCRSADRVVDETDAEVRLKTDLGAVVYECVTKDKLAILPMWTHLIQLIAKLKTSPSSSHIWQLKLFLAQVFKCPPTTGSLIPVQYAVSMEQRIRDTLTSWQEDIATDLYAYLTGTDLSKATQRDRLVSYVTFYDIPYSLELSDRLNNPIGLLVELSKCELQIDTIEKISQIIHGVLI